MRKAIVIILLVVITYLAVYICVYYGFKDEILASYPNHYIEDCTYIPFAKKKK